MSNVQPKFDSLEYATELEAAGVPEAQAKIQAKALFRVIDQQLVTKQDIKELEGKFSYDIKELEVKIKEVEVRLEVKIKELEVKLSEVEARLETKIKELEVKLSHDIQNVQRDIQMMQLEMKGMENRLVIKLGGIVTILLGLAGTLLGVYLSIHH